MARTPRSPDRPVHRRSDLWAHEADIRRLFAEGWSYRQIAESLSKDGGAVSPLWLRRWAVESLGLRRHERHAADVSADGGVRVDAIREHLKTEFTQRPIVGYNREFLDRYIPGKTFYLSAQDRARLRKEGTPAGVSVAGTYARRILEKLMVDLSWASSRMEGNTYSILDTERLIQEGKEAAGKDHKEAVMILNHKEAIRYVVDNLADINIRRTDLMNIHALLSAGLLIDPAMEGRLRKHEVGIGKSGYRPLDDQFEIEEEFSILIEKASLILDPFEQSFFMLAHVAYLQGFADVNKRTSRIASNIPLLKADLVPLSFMTMKNDEYMDGMLGVYELNDVSLLREAYISSYESSAIRYRALQSEVDVPHKGASVYRGFVREAVRLTVLELKSVDRNVLADLAQRRGVHDGDQNSVLDYVEQQVGVLHEGNLIRFGLTNQQLQAFRKEMERNQELVEDEDQRRGVTR